MNQENPLNPDNPDHPEERDGSPQDSPPPPDSASPHDSALYEIEEALKQDPRNKDLLLEATRIYHRLAMQGNEASLDMADEGAHALA